jgi:transposase
MCVSWPSPPNECTWRVRRSEGARAYAHPGLKKTLRGFCDRVHAGWYDRKTRRVRDLSCGDTRVYLEFEVRRVHCGSCGKVKRERLDFLADNRFYTKRFAYFVERRCRQASIQDVAKELKLDWHTVKELDKQYMGAQLERAGTPGPKIIGIDEVSIRKRHTYRIVVSDLICARPIWFGGQDRSEASMAEFYRWPGQKKTRGIGLAVMDMWKLTWL